jgi:hypothetical protein
MMITRLDRVGARLRYSICEALGIEMTKKWHINTHTHIHTHASQYVNMKIKCTVLLFP